MIKAIFFDVDGTLISKSRSVLSEGVIAALKQLQEKGIKLFIASGRHYLELDELGINAQFTFDGYLTLNGGYCFNQEGVIYKNPINSEGDDLYINLINDLVVAAQTAINTSLPPKKDVSRALINDVYQIDPFVTKEEIEELVALTQHCKYTQWHDGAYDIIPKQGGKQEGISAILDHYKIKVEETMAFGDGHNDIDMLQFVGTGICMENGCAETKAVCDYITDNVDNDGIVSALRYFGLL